MNSLPRSGSFFDRRSIRYPFVRLILAVTIFGIVLVVFMDAVLTLNSQRRDIQRNLTAAANSAGAAASAAVAFNDAKAARATLRMFEAYPEIKAAAFYSNQGHRLASYGDDRLLPPDVPAVGPSASDVVPLANTTTLRLPIVVDDSSVGAVYIHARLDAYWRVYLISMATIFLAGLVAGVLAFVLAMRLLDRIIYSGPQISDSELRW